MIRDWRGARSTAEEEKMADQEAEPGKGSVHGLAKE